MGREKAKYTPKDSHAEVFLSQIWFRKRTNREFKIWSDFTLLMTEGPQTSILGLGYFLVCFYFVFLF